MMLSTAFKTMCYASLSQSIVGLDARSLPLQRTGSPWSMTLAPVAGVRRARDTECSRAQDLPAGGFGFAPSSTPRAFRAATRSFRDSSVGLGDRVAAAARPSVISCGPVRRCLQMPGARRPSGRGSGAAVELPRLV